MSLHRSKNRFLKSTIFTAAIAATAIIACPKVQSQTVFDFESLAVPASGFNNGDPSLSATERMFFEDVTITNFAPGSNFGISSQVNQNLVLSQNGARIELPNSFSGTEPDAGFNDFFFGFSYSNVVNTTTPGVGNQYAAFAGSGSNGSSNYLVGSSDTSLTANRQIQSIDIAPTTYTALAVRDGDDGGAGFASGPLSESNGFFELVISGVDTDLEIRVPFGDYRGDIDIDPAPAFQTIDTSILNTNTLTFTFDGSDQGSFGLNTPLFFAADNIAVAVPEPGSLLLLNLGALLIATRRRRGSKMRVI